MNSFSPSSPRERILQAALTLLEAEGMEAVSTRAVSALADVQAPTIYRQFGDMQGLLNEVATTGFTAYLEAKGARERLNDPLEELRAGWDLHVEFGLTHPHLYRLMYGTSLPGTESPASQEAASRLRRLMQRMAEGGRLAVSVERAAALYHAAALGITLSLIHSSEKNNELSTLMREAALKAILLGEWSDTNDSTGQQAASHAVALVALLPNIHSPFSAAETTLLVEWLRRLM